MKANTITNETQAAGETGGATAPVFPADGGEAQMRKQRAEAKAASKAAKKPAPAKKAAKPAKAAKKPAKKAAKKANPDAVKGPGVLRQYAAGYNHDSEKKTAGGHVSVDCADAIATKLRGKTLDDVYAFAAKALGETEKELFAKYKHLNVGMQRMNLGNRVRAAVNAK